MEDAQPILEYLPSSFKNQSESDYITFLWEAFECNYTSQKFQFAALAYHMLYMSFVYFSIWQIKHVHPDKYQQASVFLACRNLTEVDLIGLTSPFSLSKINERTVFRMLRLIGCEQQDIKPFVKLVDERNEIAHSSGNIFYSNEISADEKNAEVLQSIEAIQLHLRPVILECFLQFLLDSHNPDDREYYDDSDQIREVLIHANYFSQKDIEACLDFDITSLSGEADYPAINALFDAFVAEYKQEE
jgi:hypothetical protein